MLTEFKEYTVIVDKLKKAYEDVIRIQEQQTTLLKSQVAILKLRIKLNENSPEEREPSSSTEQGSDRESTSST